MKTRDKIIVCSLDLFNLEGETNVSTVDIANELDISPGNLYYHFKGKEEIINELFTLFESELSDILKAPVEAQLNMRDAWFYVYVVFEQIYQHRWLYRNLNDILQRYPKLNKRFRKLMERKLSASLVIINALASHGVLEITEEARRQLAERLTMQLTFWLNYRQLRGEQSPDALLLHEGVFELVSSVAPYFELSFQVIYDDMLTLYQQIRDESLRAD